MPVAGQPAGSARAHLRAAGPPRRRRRQWPARRDRSLVRPRAGAIQLRASPPGPRPRRPGRGPESDGARAPIGPEPMPPERPRSRCKPVRAAPPDRRPRRQPRVTERGPPARRPAPPVPETSLAGPAALVQLVISQSGSRIRWTAEPARYTPARYRMSQELSGWRTISWRMVQAKQQPRHPAGVPPGWSTQAKPPPSVAAPLHAATS